MEESLESLISEQSQRISDFIEELAQPESFDPLNRPLTDLSSSASISQFDDMGQKELLVELSCSKVLATLIQLKEPSNDYNYKQIALLCDLAFYLKSIGQARFDLPYILIMMIINENSVNWLLHFWPYFEWRTSALKELRPAEKLVPTRSTGVSMVITLNLKLRELRKNNESRRDLLKERVLSLSSDIFPLFDRCFINKRFEQNGDTRGEHLFKSDDKAIFHSFWDMQEFFQDPIRFVDSFSRPEGLKTQITTVLDHIRKIEEKTYGQIGHKRKRANAPNNSVERYERLDLSDSQKNELLTLANRDFSPLFFINKEKFQEQLEGDASLRKTFLVQMYITSGYIAQILQGQFVKSLNAKVDSFQNKYGKRSQWGFLLTLPQDVRKIIQHCHPELMRTLMISNVQQVYHVNQILTNYNDFDKFYGNLVLDDEFWNSFNKRVAVKPRFWAKYGTSEISRHWTIATGLHRLVSETNGSLEDMERELNGFRSSKGDLSTWKALRVAKNIHLFKFNKVNDSTGVEGLYEDSLKDKFDQGVQADEQRTEEKFIKLEAESTVIQEEVSDVKRELESRKADDELHRKEMELMRRAEELKRGSSGGRQGEEEEGPVDKKRKSSVELESDAKRARNSSSRGISSGAVEDLDY